MAKRIILIILTVLLTVWVFAEDPSQSMGVYQARQLVDKTEYKDVSAEVTAVLVLETGGFSIDDSKIEGVVNARIEYFRRFDFPTDKKGFYEALASVPGVGLPYAKDKDYVKKVKSVSRRLDR